MVEYFNTNEKRKLLHDELTRWKGTDFVPDGHGRAVCKCGADCVSFPIAVFKNLNLIPETFTTPRYKSIRSHDDELSKIYTGLEIIEGLRKVWDKNVGVLKEADLQFGDILLCSTYRVIHHFLICVGNNMAWHCWPECGVCMVSLGVYQIQKTALSAYRFFSNE